jgi:hypothetical protein
LTATERPITNERLSQWSPPHPSQFSFVFSFVGASRYITNMLLKRILSDMAIGRVPSSLLSVLF